MLGIKFRPAGFYPFLESPVSAFSNSVLALETVFDVNTTVVEKKVLAPDNKEQMVERAEEFLIPHVPHRDERVDLVNRIIDEIKGDNTLIKVGAIAKRFDVSKRSLQRIFNKYVGVPPKWVIKRFRLHEVAGILAEKPETDWAALAHELGYYDQAHFIKDFKSIVGHTPTEYTRGLQR